MRDLISRSALKEHIGSYAGMFTDELGFAVSMEAVLRGIDFAESVDAVEVVRCKDCVHWLNEEEIEDHVCLKIYDDAGVHTVAWQNRKADDFCSYGERITDG